MPDVTDLKRYVSNCSLAQSGPRVETGKKDEKEGVYVLPAVDDKAFSLMVMMKMRRTMRMMMRSPAVLLQAVHRGDVVRRHL